MENENEEKSALVPRLRFPLFSEAWRADRVGKIAEIFKGKGIAKSDISNDGIHPCIRYGELYTVYGELVTKVLSRTSLPATELFFGEPNDVIIPSSGETKEDIATAACVAPGGIAFGSDLNVLRTRENGSFLSYYLNGPLRKNIARVAQGDSVVHLYPYQIEKLPIAMPVGNEQQKIADCLSSLDDLIVAETQKLDALKTHKKGLMQQLFPREGETVPRLRFPEFQEAGEWEQKSLGEAATFYNGRAYAKEELLERGKYTVIRVGNFFTSDKWYYSDLELDESKYCDDGDLLYAWSASFGPRIWRGNKSIYHYHIWKVVENVGVIRKFLFIALDIETERMKARSANGIGMFHITKGTIESWMSVFPTLAEQQKIADCASSLDDLITAQGKKIDALKTHKKGLMQQLFPVVDEASA